MGIRSFSVIPSTVADWARFFRETSVTPSTDSVGTDQILSGAITEPKMADDSVSTRALVDNAVDNARLRDSAARSVIGRGGATSGDPEDLVASADTHVLVRHAGVVAFSALADADIPSTIARDTEVTSAISTHEAAGDPHPGYRLESANVPWTEVSGKPIYSGTGSPESVVSASVGSLYLRTDGGAGTTLYVKESGSGNTGWVGK